MFDICITLNKKSNFGLVDFITLKNNFQNIIVIVLIEDY